MTLKFWIIYHHDYICDSGHIGAMTSVYMQRWILLYYGWFFLIMVSSPHDQHSFSSGFEMKSKVIHLLYWLSIMAKEFKLPYYFTHKQEKEEINLCFSQRYQYEVKKTTITEIWTLLTDFILPPPHNKMTSCQFRLGGKLEKYQHYALCTFTNERNFFLHISYAVFQKFYIILKNISNIFYIFLKTNKQKNTILSFKQLSRKVLPQVTIV